MCAALDFTKKKKKKKKKKAHRFDIDADDAMDAFMVDMEKREKREVVAGLCKKKYNGPNNYPGGNIYPLPPSPLITLSSFFFICIELKLWLLHQKKKARDDPNYNSDDEVYATVKAIDKREREEAAQKTDLEYDMNDNPLVK